MFIDFILFFIVLALLIGERCLWGWATNKIIGNKGYTSNWFWWGFFFGLIALIVALAKSEAYHKPFTGFSWQKEPAGAPASDEWKCACGRVNKNYIHTCVCGKNRHSQLSDQEKETLRLLKEYKMLLDNGILTQEEFDKKKRDLLNK